MLAWVEHSVPRSQLAALLLLRDQGACRDHNELIAFFFADLNDKDEIHAAKQVCYRCPVRLDCLNFALRTHEKFGIWGGLTHRERLLLRRAR